MAKKPKIISGTKEWASESANVVRGCRHNCRYCYARYDAVIRFKTVPSFDDWPNERVLMHKLGKTVKKRPGVIMFPTQHDISPENLDVCRDFILKALSAGNKLLIVSKPHLECIRAICDVCESWRKEILFRFSIGASDDAILKYWEPGAPSFTERLSALKYAYKKAFQTSISMEPLLDAANVVQTFNTLKPFVTNSIWIGKLNKIRSRVQTLTAEDEMMVSALEASQTDEKVREVYEKLRLAPLVRWKESYKSVLGIPVAETAGLDI